MRIPCDLIQDLLPLYHDEVCSSDSRTLVEEHLLECPACCQVLDDLHEKVEHPLEDWSEIQALQKTWQKDKMRTRRIRITLVLISVFVLVSPLWLTLPKNQPVPSEEIEISQVCQLKDGTIVFHMYIDDGKVLEEITYDFGEDGCYYITPKHSILEAKRNTEHGLFNAYHSFYVYEDGAFEDAFPEVAADFYIKSVPAVYVGVPGDAVLVWKQGKTIPKATPAMEKMMKGRSWSMFSDVHTIDWDAYAAYLERTLGDEMFRKEGIP
ncbi:MAG: zf-HC2 domain-containing protein [Ruminiclostridium sp.]|nr:zf-HC2 domain-containing protein [Ruminiclostridium sp.]